jgi:ABC-2 type transport system permease protein
VYLAKPVGVLTAFDEGVNAYAGVFAHLEPHDQRIFRFRPAEDQTWLRRLGTLTAAIALQQLMPFVIVALTFGAFASAEARATAHLLASTGVPRRDIVMGKALGVAVPWIGVCLAAALLGACTLLAAPSPPHLVARIAILTGVYLAYLTAWLAFSLVVSQRATTTGSALATLLLACGLMTFVVPAAAVEYVERRDPSPSPLAFAADMNQARYALPLWYDRLNAIERRLLAEHKAATVDDLPVSAQGVGLVDEEADQDRMLDEHFIPLFATHERQARRLQGLTWLAPVLAVRTLSAGLAASDVTDHVAFARAAENHRRHMVRLLNGDIVVNDLPRNRTDFGVPGITEKYYQPGREVWSKVPPFHYVPPSTADVLRTRRPALAMLGLWLIVGAVFSLRGARIGAP